MFVKKNLYMAVFSLLLQPLMVNLSCSAAIVPFTNTNITLDEIKSTYKKHNYARTIELCSQYLNTYPKDVDAILYEGLSYQKLHQCEHALILFNKVLHAYPSYMEARLGAINCYFNSKNYSQVLDVVQKGLVVTPGNAELLYLKAKALTLQGKKTEAISILKKQDDYDPSQTLLKNLQTPEEVKLIKQTKKKTKIKTINSHIPQQTSNRKNYVLIHSQRIPNAVQKGDEVENHSKFVAGVFTDNMLVNTPNQTWNLSNLYAYKVTSYGAFGGSINYASRYNQKAAQLELNAIPKLNDTFSLDLAYAYANKPELFANNLEKAELYAYLPKGVEGSFGGVHRKISHYTLDSITGSLGKYIDRYYINFRPIYFSPGSGPTSVFYRLGIRRFGDTDGQYIGLVLGDGTSPDLTDLLTVDFIKVKNRFYLFEGQQPLNKLFALQYGIGYEELYYPNNLLRTLVHVNLGIKMGYI